ncbi:MAG: hypothetical protein NUV88_03585 [Candidatus Kaiserbacteria bacterium]|nr:hypothetical protein [Candidatus Kaiserbacteria bacterium]
MFPLSYFSSSKILVAIGVSSAVFLFSGLFLYQARAQTFVNSRGNAGSPLAVNKVSAVSSGPAVGAGQKAPMLEVHIANNGLVLLRGARVISVSGSTIHVEMSWSSSNMAWAVATTYNTKFLTSKGEKAEIGDIAEGDIIRVTGKLVASGIEPIVDTDIVREL